ncbi:hypothetical protein, partial [Mesorhizobium japonicum]|uniref:hypothetical protein n=1 Tax=Mesorhizobium japonicum TaxID=2066070 RepID=UPI003B58D274
GYVAREHRPTEDVRMAQFTVNNSDYVMKADHSYIWAHDSEKAYGHDADALLVKFIEAMAGAAEPVALQVVEEVSKRAVHAVVWSRLF